MLRGARRPNRDRERGASAVEFALILPILVTLLLGIIQYGWFFYVANATSSSAREGARRVVVGDCWGSTAFSNFVKAQNAYTTSASYSPADLTPSSVKVGDMVTVTVKSNGSIVNFLPMPNGGQLTQTFKARLEDKTAGTC